ncbi:hypothetical protein [Roseixanthobacter pseudopolyaromaticivorans]|uniref:hypothetical protein n=1 Tax=Xanthobacteraceae TaxID=335928 RepID=UPI00372C9CBE
MLGRDQRADGGGELDRVADLKMIVGIERLPPALTLFKNSAMPKSPSASATILSPSSSCGNPAASNGSWRNGSCVELDHHLIGNEEQAFFREPSAWRCSPDAAR